MEVIFEGTMDYNTEPSPGLVEALQQRKTAKARLEIAQSNLAKARETYREWASRVETLLQDIMSGQTQQEIPGFAGEPDAATAKATFARPRRKHAEATR